MEFQIDINCDLGEGFGNDHLIMPYISSCNIACGGHAGNADTMSSTLDLAISHNVKAGAHPSFPDRKNFGRKVQKLPYYELVDTIRGQTLELMAMARNKKVKLHHLKPHGALYNLAARDEETARAVVAALIEVDPGMVLYAPPSSELSRQAGIQGVKVFREAFLDRGYNEDLTLVDRTKPGAQVKDVREMSAQARLIVVQSLLKTAGGRQLPIKVDTLCVHGDYPQTPDILPQLHKLLKELNIEVI